jgi:hypothetical protein
VRHAAAHSPYYRRRLAETGALGDGPVQLQRLPVLDKARLMEHFDELVCDPRLRRDQLLDWVGRLTGDRLYLGRYRVMVTSGSSGRPGLFVYDRAGWRSITSQVLRTTRWAGLRPSLPRQRVAALGGAAPSPRQPPGRRHPGRGPASRPEPAGHPAPRGAGRGAQSLPAHLPARLPLGGHVAGRRATRRPPPAGPPDAGHHRRAAHPRDDSAAHRRLRGLPLQRLRHHRGPVGRRMPAPPGHPPVRRHRPHRH